MNTKKKEKIQIRLSEPEGYYYGYFGGRIYSIVDFGKIMESAPDLIKNNVFVGWEAMEIKNDELMTEPMYRANTRNELIDILEALPLGLTAILRDYNGFELEMNFPSFMPKISIALKHPMKYLKTGDYETTARDVSVEQRDFYFKEWIDQKALIGLFTEI